MFLPSVPVAPTVLLPSANTSTKAAGDMLLHSKSRQDMRNYVKEGALSRTRRASRTLCPLAQGRSLFARAAPLDARTARCPARHEVGGASKVPEELVATCAVCARDFKQGRRGVPVKSMTRTCPLPRVLRP